MTAITFLLCHRMLATSTTLPIEMLQTAEGAATGNQKRSPNLIMNIASVNGESVQSSTGISITPNTSLTELPQNDLIFVPGLWRNPRPIINEHPEIITFLQQSYERGSRICTVGTGACFLAETGLLNNKSATTHWHYFDQFAKDYPQVNLKREFFITQSERLYCAGSINALADLTVHLIKDLFDEPIAKLVQRHFSHEIRRDYDYISFQEGGVRNLPDEEIAQARAWLQDHYAEDVCMNDLAGECGLNPRTFHRRFKTATGQTPLELLQSIRVREAQELLQTSNLKIGEIALCVGYQDASHLARLFRKSLGTTPNEYRQTVRRKLFRSH